MIWIIIFAIAATVMGLLIFIGRIPRASWELGAAALFLGIAGYAWQGSPGAAGAPKPPIEQAGEFDESLIGTLTGMGKNFGDAQAWLVLADAQSRQGKFATAAAALKKGLESHPDSPELWIALGNALVGHADGLLSPAAQYAYQKAATLDPSHPGPPFFLGLALATSGRFADARTVWTELLARTPQDAEWRADLESRIARVDQILASQGMGVPVRPDSATTEPAATPQQGQ